MSDEVDVRVDEVELGPTFRATIVGIYWQRQGILEYTVEEADGQRTDGYSEDLLSPAVYLPRRDEPSGKEDAEHTHKCRCCGLWWHSEQDESDCCSD